MIIGINTASSQSGRAFCADLMSRGYTIQGYSHNSQRGEEFVRSVTDLEGLFLDRPQNSNNEHKTFVNLGKSGINHNLEELINKSDFIILAEPSHYFVQSVKEMVEYGLKEKRIPIILSPGRTCSAVYLWKILGKMYPIVSFSTCPYSCKAPRPDTAFIKCRKRNFVASLEGEFTLLQVTKLGELFPQAIFNKVPATTSIGNMGAVFHPASYLLNFDAIRKAEAEDRVFSFYMEGIAARPEVGDMLQAIDNMRINIAKELRIKVFAPEDEAREREWLDIMSAIHHQEEEIHDTGELRKLRRDGLLELNKSITSAFHWLDYTYGVSRVRGESFSEAIGRTSTYKRNSIPQWRYIEEDVATGLIPMTSLAKRLGIEHGVADEILRIADEKCPDRIKDNDRTLEEFSTGYLVDYLTGRYFNIRE